VLLLFVNPESNDFPHCNEERGHEVVVIANGRDHALAWRCREDRPASLDHPLALAGASAGPYWQSPRL